jgi:hypothetical protein
VQRTFFITYKSMFSASNWLLEPPFLTTKLLRKLTGILEVPGIFCQLLLRVCNYLQHRTVKRGDEFRKDVGLFDTKEKLPLKSHAVPRTPVTFSVYLSLRAEMRPIRVTA